MNPTELLLSLQGDWEGTTRTWFEPGKLADESPWRGTIRQLFDSRFITHEYEGRIQGKPHRGFLMAGLNDETGKIDVSWIDTFHMGTGIMISTGDARPDGFSVLGSYGDGKGGPRWGWRTDWQRESDTSLILRAFNIMPGHPEALALETRYRRVFRASPASRAPAPGAGGGSVPGR